MRTSRLNQYYPKLLLFLGLVVLDVPIIHSQTSIVAARRPNEVVIGADSKRKISEFDSAGNLLGVTSTLACKIQKAEGFYFGCSGPCGEVDVASIIVKTSRRIGTIQRKVEILVPLVEDALNRFLKNKSQNALRRYTSRPTMLQLLFVGIQDRVPLIVGVDFHYRRADSGVMSVRAGATQTCGATPDACTHLAVGKTEAIAAFSRKKGSMDFLARAQPAFGVEYLIRLEIEEEGDDVGPPIDILRITRSGAQWIRRKRQCEVETSRHHAGVRSVPHLGLQIFDFRLPIAGW